MLSRTAVRRTATAVATAALAGTALAACGAQHGGASAGAVADAKARTPAPSATPSPSSKGATAPGVPAQRTVPPQKVPSQTIPGQRTTKGPTPPPATATPSPTPTPPTGAPQPGTGSRTDPGTHVARAGEAIQHTLESGGKSVALTFDDGPDPRWTPQILDLLAEHHVKATFCEIGPNAAAHPELVRRITAEGHRLCDHSVHHNEQQSGKSLTYNTHEIADAQNEIAKAAGPGAKLWYYRAPGGDFTPPIRHIAADHGLRPLGWTADSRDWARPGAAAVVANVNHDLRPGSIVLMHDGGGDRTETVQALSTLLDQLDAQGWTYTFPAR